MRGGGGGYASDATDDAEEAAAAAAAAAAAEDSAAAAADPAAEGSEATLLDPLASAVAAPAAFASALDTVDDLWLATGMVTATKGVRGRALPHHRDVHLTHVPAQVVVDSCSQNLSSRSRKIEDILLRDSLGRNSNRILPRAQISFGQSRGAHVGFRVTGQQRQST